jgi:hypothetical protein
MTVERLIVTISLWATLVTTLNAQDTASRIAWFDSTLSQSAALGSPTAQANAADSESSWDALLDPAPDLFADLESGNEAIHTSWIADEFGESGEAAGCLCRTSAEAEHKITGFIDLNYFWDERDANWFTVYSMAQLPHDFTYFSLLNLVGQFDQASQTENLVDFYTEQNLWLPIAKDSQWLGAIDYSVQWVDASFLDPLLRFGVQWRVKDTSGPLGEFFSEVLDIDYRVYFHVIETDGSGIQIEHFYLRQFCDGRYYVRGFVDHDINKDGSSDFVSGAQMGVKLFGGLHLAAEHRYNSFQPSGNKSGWKLGFEYNIQFR